MKRIYLCIMILVALPALLRAQTSEYRNSIGGHLGFKEYSGDLDKKIYKFEDLHIAVGLSYARYLNASLDGAVVFSHGILTDKSVIGTATRGFQASVNNFNLLGRYKFSNGYILPEDFFISPFVQGGVGLSFISNDFYRIGPRGGRTDGSDSRQDLNIPFGAGFHVHLAPQWSATLQSTYHWYPGADLIDNFDQNDDGQDRFAFTSVGVAYHFGKASDRDGDGITDRKDDCPDVPGIPEFNGCPDKDADGIMDKEDACPDVAGPVAFKGCPDTDGDDIPDNTDSCPEVAGLAAFNGCPDQDGDGIQDSEDTCPEHAGTAEHGGCPDTDGDGLPDKDDRCPEVAGTEAYKGCPDKDGDTVPDIDDACPDEPGIVANKGCPEIKEETKKVFAQALRGIQFESGNDVIKRASYGILDQVVQVMNDNPAYKLRIMGHTDSQGKADMNMDLSQRRADAVKQYLTEKGIAGTRMTAQGFGEDQPVATNDTAAGRAKNRRVAFKVEF